MKGQGGWWLLILPAFLLMSAFHIAPIAQVLAISFTEPTPGLGNYERLFTSESVQRVILTTLRICAITTALALLLGCVLACRIALAAFDSCLEQAARGMGASLGQTLRWVILPPGDGGGRGAAGGLHPRLAAGRTRIAPAAWGLSAWPSGRARSMRRTSSTSPPGRRDACTEIVT